MKFRWKVTPMRPILRISALIPVLLLLGAGCAGFRKDAEYRSVKAAGYELSVQRGGRIDVRTGAGEPLLKNVYPMVWFDDDSAPKPLPVDGRFSMRQEVNTPLGRGQGIVLSRDSATWDLRTYTVQPFLTAQVSYTNTGRRPVKVRMLMPWSVGGRAGGEVHLGAEPDRTRVLGYGTALFDPADEPELSTGGGWSINNLAAFNPVSNRILMAGFLTADQAYSTVQLEHAEADASGPFDLFQAACVYDPPVEVQPGETLISEEFYLSLLETNPFVALERYGQAVAQTNRVPLRQTPAAPAWLVPPGAGPWPDREAAADAARFVAEHLAPYGTRQVLLSAAEPAPAWNLDAPATMASLRERAAAVRENGLSPGLAFDPVSVPADAELVREHPDWARPSSWRAEGTSEPVARVLDVGVPEAADWLSALGAALTRDAGFSVLALGAAPYQLAAGEDYGSARFTRVQAVRTLLHSLHRGAGPGVQLWCAGPVLPCGPWAHALGPGEPVLLRRGLTETEELLRSVRRYYFTPYLYAPQAQPVSLEGGNSLAALRARLTAHALLGAAVTVTGRPGEVDPARLASVQRTSPSLLQPARPVDLFDSEAPVIWAVPQRPELGDWTLVAVFNWDEAESAQAVVYLASAGMDSNLYYTVYDFWEDRYHGAARHSLTVEVPPGGVRMLGFRAYSNRPTLIGAAHHIGQGMQDLERLRWDEANSTIEGMLRAVAGRTYALRFLAPEGYRAVSHEPEDAAELTQQGRVVRLDGAAAETGSLLWRVRFEGPAQP